MKTETFTHKGNQYEVRTISDGLSVFVRVFSNGKPANGLRYEQTLETVHDLAVVADLDVVKALIYEAKKNITDH